MNEERILTEIPLYDGCKNIEEKAILDDLYNAFQNNGMVYKNSDKSGDLSVGHISIKDIFKNNDLEQFVPRVIDQIVYEAIMPKLQILPALFQKIKINRDVDQIKIMAIGELEAGEIGDNGEYPTSRLGGGTESTTKLSFHKYGIKFSYDESILENNEFDVLNVWLRAAGRALARLKETLAVRMLSNFGTVVFDNDTTTNPVLGSLSGRDIEGNFNGSMTEDDLYEMYIYMLHMGFNPDTILINPLSFRIWIYNTAVRELLENGSHWNPIYGETAPGWATTYNGLGIRTRSVGTTDPSTTPRGTVGYFPYSNTLNPLSTTLFTKPTSGILGNMKVIVSPRIPFTENVDLLDSTGASIRKVTTCSVMMADSSRCGVYAEKSSLRKKQWDDIERDVKYIAIDERYAMNILEMGKGIIIAENVVIERNYTFDNTNTVILEPINRDTRFVS